MAKAAKQDREKIYECEVGRRRLKGSGKGYEHFWKIKEVSAAMQDGDTDFRCKECGGAVKLYGKNKENGPAPHAEHRVREDSEFCPSGMYFRAATDGREPRRSAHEVQFGDGR